MADEKTGSPGFDVDAFLARPLTARVATDGPTVRPLWYLWEDQAFWMFTGPWAKLLGRVQANPHLAVIVDECDVRTGVVRQVIARGRCEILPFDAARGRRELVRYLGPDESLWDARFRGYVDLEPAESGAVWLRLPGAGMIVRDMSYTVPG